MVSLDVVLTTCPGDGSRRRFVLLRHDLPDSAERESHLDLMLDQGSVLWTWAVPLSVLEHLTLGSNDILGSPEPTTPFLTDGVVIEALPDHRRDYLEYEGPVSRGRGRVVRWASGHYVLTPSSSASVRLDLFLEEIGHAKPDGTDRALPITVPLELTEDAGRWRLRRHSR